MCEVCVFICTGQTREGTEPHSQECLGEWEASLKEQQLSHCLLLLPFKCLDHV